MGGVFYFHINFIFVYKKRGWYINNKLYTKNIIWSIWIHTFVGHSYIVGQIEEERKIFEVRAKTTTHTLALRNSLCYFNCYLFLVSCCYWRCIVLAGYSWLVSPVLGPLWPLWLWLLVLPLPTASVLPPQLWLTKSLSTKLLPQTKCIKCLVSDIMVILYVFVTV